MNNPNIKTKQGTHIDMIASTEMYKFDEKNRQASRGEKMEPFLVTGSFLFEAEDIILDPTILIAAAPNIPIGNPFKKVLRENPFFCGASWSIQTP